MKKICTRCNVEKALSEFYIRKDRPCGVYSRCAECSREMDRARIPTPEFKHKKKIIDALPRNRERRNLYLKTPRGIESYKKYADSPKAKDTDRRQRLSKYGITEQEYDAKYRKQNGVCDICGKLNINGKRLGVDHNHKTGRVRSLLCSSCNLVIGHAKESIVILTSAIEYLEKWQRIENLPLVGSRDSGGGIL